MRGSKRGTRGRRGRGRGQGGQGQQDADNDEVVTVAASPTAAAQNVLQNIVNSIPISQDQQERLDEQAAMEEGQESTTPTVPAQAQSFSPPGAPIPLFTVQCWRATWRRHFYTDWRWAKDKKKPNIMKVWARCKTGKCAARNPPYYYSGAANAFTNFEKHLESSHQEKYKAFLQTKNKKDQDDNQQSIVNFVDRPVVTSKARQQRLDSGFALVVATDNLAPNIARRPNFRNWIHDGMAGYRLPGLERLRNKLIPATAESTKKKLWKILIGCTSFTVVLDIWSSKSMMGFIGFTLICVNREFERFTIFLGVKLMTVRHTAENILAEYDQMLSDWNIPRTLIAMVKTDGGSNMVANTFKLNIPGWTQVSEEQLRESSSITDSAELENAPAVGAASTTVTIENEEEMVELEIDDDEENEPLWSILQEMGIDVAEAATLDEEDSGEIWNVEEGLNDIMPSSDTIVPPANKEDYALQSKLRSDCVAHKLQLVIKDGLKAMSDQVQSVISHVSKIVNCARSSGIDTQMIEAAVGFRLPKKNATRWNSSFYMLATFVKAMDADPTLLNRLRAVKTHSPLTATEVIILREVVAILKPFERASDDFQADFETIGNVIPAYLGLLNLLTLTVKERNGVDVPNPKSSLATIVKKCTGFVSALRASLVRRFRFVLYDVNYVLGTILDPRFKKGWIKISGLPEDAVLEAVKEEIESRYRVQREQADSRTDQDQPVAAEGTATNQNRSGPPSRKRRPSQSLYSCVIDTPRPPSTSVSSVLEELETYLGEPTVPMLVAKDPLDPEGEMTATKPLKYWHSNATRFPVLSGIGRDAVSVAASSGSIERCFSTASDILSAKRNRTKPDLFANLMLIKCNSRLNGQ